MKNIIIRLTVCIICACLLAEGVGFAAPEGVSAQEDAQSVQGEVQSVQGEAQAAPETVTEAEGYTESVNIRTMEEQSSGGEEPGGQTPEEPEPTEVNLENLKNDPCIEVSMNEDKMSGEIFQYYYTGKKITPKVTLYYCEKTDEGKENRYIISTNYCTVEVGAKNLGPHNLKVTAKTGAEPLITESGSKITFTGSGELTDCWEIIEKNHVWGAWKKTKAATVFAAGQKQSTCIVCGKVKTAEVARLTPTIQFNMSKVVLKKKQSTNKFKVTGLAAGDSVKSYKSSNKKIFTVSSTGKIKAKKKTGTAKLTVRLASGKKKTVKVKVQSGSVKTSSLSFGMSRVYVQKGRKYTLKAIKTPLTSKQKVTYKSSNKKVATVNKKGVVTAKKKGTATITAMSGGRKKTCKVVVTPYYIIQPGADSQAFLGSCKKLANIIMADGNWTYYSGSKLTKTFESARAGERLTSCANYVNYCMQDFGSLAVGMMFYSDSKGKIVYQTGNDYQGNEYTKQDVEAILKQNYDIIPIGGKKAEEVAVSPGLEPGDICLWNGHTNVFAGFNSDQVPMWYDAGRASTAKKKPGSIFTNMYRASWVSSLKIYYILRLKK